MLGVSTAALSCALVTDMAVAQPSSQQAQTDAVSSAALSPVRMVRKPAYGDRRNARPADASRLSSPTTRAISHPRPAQSQLRHLVRGYTSWIHPNEIRAGQDAQPESNAGPNEAARQYIRRSTGTDVEDPRCQAVPRHGHPGIPVTLRDQGLWLRYLKTDAAIPVISWATSRRASRTQLGHFDSPAAAGKAHQSGQPGVLMAEHRRFRFDLRSPISVIGQTASPRASFLSPNPRAPQASSATSCSRCGIGRRRPPTCMI